MWFDPDGIDTLVQIGGLIRFSLPTEGGFQTNPDRHADKLALLYAPKRMEQRFRYFETICLPTLKNQTDKDFRVGVVVGESLPAQYRRRLEALLEDLPQTCLIEKPIIGHHAAVAQAYNEIFDRKTPLRLTFRLDDDDGLAQDYIAQVRATLPHLLALSGGLELKPVCLTFSKGFTLTGPPHNRHFVAAIDRAPLSAGLAVLARAEQKPLVMTIPHMSMKTNMKTIVDPRPFMNLRSLHSSNDSEAVLQPSRRIALSPSEIGSILHERFRLDMNKLLVI